jgi:hypothetical protein
VTKREEFLCFGEIKRGTTGNPIKNKKHEKITI